MKTSSDDFIAKEQATIRKPLELYEFELATDGTVWRYTSYDSDVVFDGDTYSTTPIKRGKVTYDAQLRATKIQISVDRLSEAVIKYLVKHPVETTWVTITKTFADFLTEGVVIFKGEIGSVTFSGQSAKLDCTGYEIFLSQKIPRFRFQIMCNHFLFDPKCGLDKDDHKVDTTVASVETDERTLVVNSIGGHADNFFTFGWLEKGADKRMIISHTGTSIVLQHRLADIIATDSVTIYGGCDRTIQICAAKYDNVVQYGGFPYIPLVNPATLSGPPTMPRVEQSDSGKK